jgi:hypothetical protein
MLLHSSPPIKFLVSPGCNPKWREEVIFWYRETSKSHEPLKAQRKAGKAKGISGFLALDFLCVLSASVVIGFFMGL